MSIHVAILYREYVEMILAGTKTVESRLSKVRCPPWGQVRAGERLFFKVSSGSFCATAVAEAVLDLEGQTPADIDRLRERWNPTIRGDDAYWAKKRQCPFVTLVHLRDVEPLDVGPRYRVQQMRAWYVLDEEVSPLREVTLTRGAIRNGYVSLSGVSAQLREQAVTLVMPDGAEVTTEFTRGGPMLRWRGWRGYFERDAMEAGDTVRLVALGERRYRVQFVRAAGCDAAKQAGGGSGP